MRLDRRNCAVLDVGCGGGGSLVSLIQWGFEPTNLFGIDIVEDRVRDGKIKLPNINLVHGDASRMDFQKNSFDLVMESTMFIQLTDNSCLKKLLMKWCE